MRINFDSNSWWIGYYKGPNCHYICPLPTVAISWERKLKVKHHTSIKPKTEWSKKEIGNFIKAYEKSSMFWTTTTGKNIRHYYPDQFKVTQNKEVFYHSNGEACYGCQICLDVPEEYDYRTEEDK